MYIVCTCMNHVCTCIYHVHGITSCLNRFSWPTERCRYRSERHPSAVCCGLRLLSSYCTGTQWSTVFLYIVYTLYIHALDMYVQITYSYVHCTYMYMLLISVIMFCPDGLKSSSKRLLLCCKTLHSILKK